MWLRAAYICVAGITVRSTLLMIQRGCGSECHPLCRLSLPLNSGSSCPLSACSLWRFIPSSSGTPVKLQPLILSSSRCFVSQPGTGRAGREVFAFRWFGGGGLWVIKIYGNFVINKGIKILHDISLSQVIPKPGNCFIHLSPFNLTPHFDCCFSGYRHKTAETSSCYMQGEFLVGKAEEGQGDRRGSVINSLSTGQEAIFQQKRLFFLIFCSFMDSKQHSPSVMSMPSKVL